MTDKYTERYNVSLSFINDILKSVNIPPINNMSELKIKRELIKTIDCLPFMEKLFSCYKKEKLKYYTRNRIKNYILTVLKILLSKINYKLTTLRITEEDLFGKNLIVTYYTAQSKNML